MTADIIDGKAFAATVRARVAEEVAKLKASHGITPGLAVVLVGGDPASQVYVRNKGKQTKEAGMNSWEYRLPAETSEAEILAVGVGCGRPVGFNGNPGNPTVCGVHQVGVIPVALYLIAHSGGEGRPGG